jgi:hypothetical protein
VAACVARKLGSAEGVLVGDPFPDGPLRAAAPATRGLFERIRRITR